MNPSTCSPSLILQLAGGIFSSKNCRGLAGFGNAEDLHHELRKIDWGYFFKWLVASLIIGFPIVHWIKWHPWWIAGTVSALVGIIAYYWRWNDLDTDGPDEKERQFIKKWRKARRAGISSGLIDHLTVIIQSYEGDKTNPQITEGFQKFLEVHTREYLLILAGRMIEMEVNFQGGSALDTEANEYLPACRFAESMGISFNTNWRVFRTAMILD